jgi:23S rRNA pseudouridine1911/1915/1917 synthase
MHHRIHLSLTIETEKPTRLDQYLSQTVPEYSRARWQSWIKAGKVVLNNTAATKPNIKVQTGDNVCIDVQLEAECHWQAQAIPLNIIHEDETLLIINKPADCVVHPAAGHKDNTLVNALLHHCPDLDKLPRAGIIHRLDKDTTGLMVVPKTLTAHAFLSERLQTRAIKRHYRAIVYKEVISGGHIEAPIGRHPVNRLKMAVNENGKEAVTHYRVRQKFKGFTELDIQLETGRTHQIRVHLNHIGFPIIGDPLYSSRTAWTKGIEQSLKKEILTYKRQMLHATLLSLEHPQTNTLQTWQPPPPEDYLALLETLSTKAS